MPIRKRRNGYYLDVYIDGKRVRKTLGTKDEHAARILEQTILGLHRKTTPKQNALGIIDLVLPQDRKGVLIEDLGAWYESCLKEERVDTLRKTIRQRLNNIRIFAEWCKQNSNIKFCEEVESEQAFAFSQHLGSRGILGKTLNSYCGDLSTTWKMLQKRSKVKDNPWTLVRVRRDKENEHTGRAFTQDEFDRILKVCDEVGHDWRGMVICGAYTGLRMTDVAHLKWNGNPDADIIVDLDRRLIFGTPSKTERVGIKVSIPMHEAVYGLLKGLQRNGEYVFPCRAERHGKTKAVEGDVLFGEILERAGVTKSSDRDKLSYHCLRHTFVSWLAEAGVAQDVRMKLTGHTNADTHAIYDHDRSAAEEAIAKLN